MNADTIAGYALGLGLLGSGSVLLWRLAASPAARSRRTEPALGPWPVPPSGLLLLFALGLCGAILGQYLSALVLGRVRVGYDARQVLVMMGYEAGLIGGVAGFFLTVPGNRRTAPAPWRTLRDGFVTFLVALPPVWIVDFAWQELLECCHVPIRLQDPVTLFLGLRSTFWKAGFVLVATVAAPISEELLFRAGLFRFCRGRLPRWLAILGPAVVFAGAHLLQSPLDGLAAFAPLVVLGVVFSLAYERTGRIGTTMVAHGLFNLTTIVLILLGLST